MDLKIKIDKNLEAVRQKQRFVWKWYSKPYYVGVLYFLLSGIVFLYKGITSVYTWKVIPVQGNSTMYNLHFGLTIGSALVITAVIRFLSIQSSKKNFFYELDLYNKPLSKNETFIVVNDDAITYSDSLIRQEYKWIKFSGFVYKTGFLMLVRAKKVPTSFVVQENECSTDEFKSIIELVRIKLKQIE